MKKFLILIALFFFVLIKPVFAYDLTVTCGSSACTKDTNTPLFDSTTVWYPGFWAERTIHFINTTGDTRDLSTEAKNSLVTGGVDTVMTCAFKESGITIWENTLHSLYSSSAIGLPGLNPNNTRDITIRVAMDTTAGNEYQNKATSFDLAFTISGISESVVVTVTSSNDGGGGDGTTGTTTSVGGAVVPTLAPVIPFFGLFRPLAGEGVVAGETTQNPPEVIELPEEGQVGGAATCEKCTWWSILLIQAVALLIFYKRTKNKPAEIRKRSVVISTLAYVLFLLVNNHCRSGFVLWISSSSLWCNYFIVLVTLVHLFMSRFVRHTPTSA